MLIGQFIAEAFLTTGLAGILALLIVQLALPGYNALIGTPLIIPYGSISFWGWAAGFLVVTSLLSGSYPAFYLSSFQPTRIFVKQFRKSSLGVSTRQILVVLQFTFAIILVIATIIVRDQLIYGQERDKGYANTHLIRVDFVGEVEKNYPLIKQELLRSGAATSVTKTMTSITNDGWRTWGLRWAGENPKDTNTALTLFSTDADLVKTAGLQLIAGRDINIHTYPTDSFSVLLNETAVKTMGFKNPLGQLLTNRQEGTNWRGSGRGERLHYRLALRGHSADCH